MSKRSAQEKIDYYSAKIRKLEKKQTKNRRRVIVYSSSESENESDVILPSNIIITETNGEPEAELSTDPVSEALPADLDTTIASPETTLQNVNNENIPELDSELLSALGDAGEEIPVYGENIHPDLAQRWMPILRKGLTKEVKEKLRKDYVVPENCKQLRAPSLNPEIVAAINDASKARDKKIEAGQQQLGLGITAVSKALGLLLTNEASEDKQTKIEVIKKLSDACRILTDLHYSENQSRIKAITAGLDKSFLSVVQDVESDEYLFGAKLGDKIRASKTIEKQGSQLKRTSTTQKLSLPSTSQYQPTTTARSRFQGNWSGPPRFQSSNRGGRGAAQRTSLAARRTQPTYNQPRPTNYRHRAPTRQ